MIKIFLLHWLGRRAKITYDFEAFREAKLDLVLNLAVVIKLVCDLTLWSGTARDVSLLMTLPETPWCFQGRR